jgi:hypothetical protein
MGSNPHQTSTGSKQDLQYGSGSSGYNQDDTVRVSNQTRADYQGSLNTGSYNISQFSVRDSGYNTSPQLRGNRDSGYSSAQFSTPTRTSGVVPKHSGFPSLVPLPSSSYGIHRRSRSSAVLLRAQKFESRLQQQQLQSHNASTRSSTERIGPR